MNKFKKIFLSFSKKERGVFLAASFLFLVSLVGLIIFLIGRTTEAVPSRGGSFTEGFVGQPAFINPILAASEIDKGLVRLLFGRLQDLATKIEVDEEGRIWNVRLKEGLTWSDGEKLNSDDVIFAIQAIQNPDSHSPLSPDWQGVRVNRLSELELQFTLAAPYGFFQDNLLGLYVVPKHTFEDVPVANWKISDFNLRPISSGPYKFLSFDKETSGFISVYRLTVNPNFVAPEALIENFNFRFFKEVPKLIEAFNAGQIDGFDGIQATDLNQIKRPFEVVPFRLPNYYAVFMNQSKNLALKEQAVREALSLAAPKKELITQVFEDKAVIVNGPIPPGAFYFSPTVRGEHSEPNKAAQVLEAGGWRKIPVEELNEEEEFLGYREKTIKKTRVGLELSLVAPQVPFLVKTATLLKEAWEAVGFRINLIVLPSQEVTDIVIKNRDYELILFGNALNKSSDLFPFWHSSGRFHPGLNLALYNNKDADELIESIRLNFDDETRKEQFDELQQLIAEDYPAVFLYSPDYLYVTNKNLKGVEPALIGEPADRFLDIQRWHLKTVRVLK